ncbi:cation:proton antiporter domain-containing protein [Streptomyces anulatus]|uniref:cation:proton antiporter domain-containing protein n=1 Tax=Streptomyces anulatus TaxID=1892 RepID=UPI0033DACE49
MIFTDAVRIDFRTLRREYVLPLRLLAVGMPVGIVVGTVMGLLVFDTGQWWAAALLAAVLIPTDAALGAAVVSDRRLPVRVRQTLNVESGLNDGIALPVVMLLLALTATEEGGIGSATWWASFAARQIGLGAALGMAAGLAGGLLIEKLGIRGGITTTYERLATLAVAVIAFTEAELSGGNGFIAAFAAGLAFGAVARARCPQVHEFAEVESTDTSHANAPTQCVVSDSSMMLPLSKPRPSPEEPPQHSVLPARDQGTFRYPSGEECCIRCNSAHLSA